MAYKNFTKKVFLEWLSRQDNTRCFNLSNVNKCIFYCFLIENKMPCESFGVESYIVSGCPLQDSPLWSVDLQRFFFNIQRTKISVAEIKKYCQENWTRK